MKKFALYILLLVVFTLSSMFVLDLVYTYTYNNGAYRNKVMWVRDLQPDTKLDYVILGSSRVNNFINPKIIKQHTTKTGLNLGMNAANSIENYTMLQQLFRFHKPKSVYVQVDSQYKQTFPDPIGEVAWMPYIKEDLVYNSYKNFGNGYSAYKNIPFYRYQKFESQLGFRNVLSSLMGSGFNYNNSLGYVPLTNTLNKELDFIPDADPSEKNIFFEKIIDLCDKEGVDVYFFTAPFYKFKGDLSKFNELLPNYTDFSDSIPQRNYFNDQTHVNDAGATIFTEIFIETYFPESQ